jgi:hypothetical protein
VTLEEAKISLDRYGETGVPTGSFLQAVLSNDLMDAVGRADDTSLLNLHRICMHVYNELPSDCWGSREKVKAFIEKKREALGAGA